MFKILNFHNSGAKVFNDWFWLKALSSFSSAKVLFSSITTTGNPLTNKTMSGIRFSLLLRLSILN